MSTEEEDVLVAAEDAEETVRLEVVARMEAVVAA
jgi:hypothetical protein